MICGDIPISYWKVIEICFTPHEQAVYDEYSLPHKKGLFTRSKDDPNCYI